MTNLILNIDTSAGTASVSLSSNGMCLGTVSNPDQREHASFLQPAIQQLLQSCNVQLQNLAAVSVVNGPGSYTGLRVGLASAKGICYALNLPLITINTLTLMAKAAAMEQIKTNHLPPLLCPMIDARRMEVFTAVYDGNLNELSFPQAMILDEKSFVAFLLQNKMLFFGDGAFKMKSITDSSNALFASVYDTCNALCTMSYDYLLQDKFANLAYAEPFYLKDFFNK